VGGGGRKKKKKKKKPVMEFRSLFLAMPQFHREREGRGLRSSSLACLCREGSEKEITEKGKEKKGGGGKEGTEEKECVKEG